MTLEMGIFYYEPQAAFPCVVLKIIDADRVLVRVWSESGDRTEVALRSDSPGSNVFVSG